MAGIDGNYIKTSLYVGDVREESDPAVNRGDMMTIQSLNYSVNRGRNANGDPHGGVKPSEVDFVIRTPKSEQSRRIYKMLRDGEVLKLSFLFNPHYTMQGDLDDYHSATIITGVVSSAKEEYTLQQSRVNETRIILRVSMMIYTMTFIGSGSEHTLRFK